ncbi:hypothetical protein BJX63DRAFT_395833 [Aspergillus granulosus]|uniref:Uncharacterized protein n=1 Tax=Aspergillus granulosus TaxID=176169 RepID=A0ABR4HBL4_9EURO
MANQNHVCDWLSCTDPTEGSQGSLRIAVDYAVSYVVTRRTLFLVDIPPHPAPRQSPTTSATRPYPGLQPSPKSKRQPLAMDTTNTA